MKAAEGMTEHVPTVPVAVGAVRIPAPGAWTGRPGGHRFRRGGRRDARGAPAHEESPVADDTVVVRARIAPGPHVHGPDGRHLGVDVAAAEGGGCGRGDDRLRAHDLGHRVGPAQPGDKQVEVDRRGRKRDRRRALRIAHAEDPHAQGRAAMEPDRGTRLAAQGERRTGRRIGEARDADDQGALDRLQDRQQEVEAAGGIVSLGSYRARLRRIEGGRVGGGDGDRRPGRPLSHRDLALDADPGRGVPAEVEADDRPLAGQQRDALAQALDGLGDLDRVELQRGCSHVAERRSGACDLARRGAMAEVHLAPGDLSLEQQAHHAGLEIDIDIAVARANLDEEEARRGGRRAQPDAGGRS